MNFTNNFGFALIAENVVNSQLLRSTTKTNARIVEIQNFIRESNSPKAFRTFCAFTGGIIDLRAFFLISANFIAKKRK